MRSTRPTAGRPISDARSSSTGWTTATAALPSAGRTGRRLAISRHPGAARGPGKRAFRIPACAGMTVLACGVASTAAAQTKFPADAYPSRPIRVIVPFAPGGGLDITARLIGQKLTEKWGQNFVVDARPGAATIVGTEIAARAVPDG